jgi:hypothetical protein
MTTLNSVGVNYNPNMTADIDDDEQDSSYVVWVDASTAVTALERSRARRLQRAERRRQARRASRPTAASSLLSAGGYLYRGDESDDDDDHDDDDCDDDDDVDYNDDNDADDDSFEASQSDAVDAAPPIVEPLVAHCHVDHQHSINGTLLADDLSDSYDKMNCLELFACL